MGIAAQLNVETKISGAGRCAHAPVPALLAVPLPQLPPNPPGRQHRESVNIA
jgi:hypothetical protein